MGQSQKSIYGVIKKVSSSPCTCYYYYFEKRKHFVLKSLGLKEVQTTAFLQNSAKHLASMLRRSGLHEPLSYQESLEFVFVFSLFVDFFFFLDLGEWEGTVQVPQGGHVLGHDYRGLISTSLLAG